MDQRGMSFSSSLTENDELESLRAILTEGTFLAGEKSTGRQQPGRTMKP